MRSGLQYRRLIRRCRRIYRGLDLPVPFEEDVLTQRVARQRGRPIELMPITARADLPCGILVATGESDYILYRADTGPLHRRHIVVHEIAHVLFDHARTAPLAFTGVLLPHLSPALVGRVLGRTVYTEPQEQEAELLASMILSRAGRRTAESRSADPASSPRLEFLFSGPAAAHPSGPPGADTAGTDG